MHANTAEIRPPNRVLHRSSFTIPADAGVLFPLFCPVREMEWVPGWRPQWMIAEGGLVEDGCIFQTLEEHGPAIWVVEHYDESAHDVAMVKTAAGYLVTRLRFSLSETTAGDTDISVSYEYTSLGPDGDRFIANCTAQWFGDTVQGWKRLIEDYLSIAENGGKPAPVHHPHAEIQ